MRKLIPLIFLIMLSAAVGKGIYTLKDGFSARRIHGLDNETNDHWDEEVQLALAQPFFYIGRGRQCFAFASQDGRYVLKFPRTDIYKTPLWARALPVHSYRTNLEATHLAAQAFIMTSFDLALHELPNQTAMIVSHLGRSPSRAILTVVDKLGCTHHLPLGQTSFVLQYNKPLLMKAFGHALQQGKRHEAEQMLDAWLEVVVERAQKGILNRDRSFLRNYSFDGQKAYQIDVGSFFRKPELDAPTAYQKSIRDSADAMQEWLAKTDPDMLAYFNQKLNSVLSVDAAQDGHPRYLDTAPEDRGKE